MAACSVARVQVQPFRAAAPARGSGARVQQQQPRLAPLRAAAVDVAALEAESLAGLTAASPAAAVEAAPTRRRKTSRRFGTELSKVRGGSAAMANQWLRFCAAGCSRLPPARPAARPAQRGGHERAPRTASSSSSCAIVPPACRRCLARRPRWAPWMPSSWRWTPRLPSSRRRWRCGMYIALAGMALALAHGFSILMALARGMDSWRRCTCMCSDVRLQPAHLVAVL